MSRLRHRASIVGLLALALLAAACGDSGGGTAATTRAGGASGTTASGATSTTKAAGSTTTAAHGHDAGPVITVGSSNFSENVILAEIYAGALEAAGFTVERKLNLGSREIAQPALRSGEIDFLPEYVGTLLTFLKGEPTTNSDET